MSMIQKDMFYLVGPVSKEISVDRLPSSREVLCFFLFLHLFKKKTVQESTLILSRQLIDIYAFFEIKIRYKGHVCSKIKQLFNKWCCLKKKRSKSVISQTLVKNEHQFIDCLDDVFDVAFHDKNSDNLKKLKITFNNQSIRNKKR